MRRMLILVAVAGVCAVAATVTALATHGAATAAASGSCQLGTKAGQIKHVIYLQFDNTHFRRDNSNVASDLEQMPNLLNFLKGNGTLLTNDHTILISHTAGGILSSLTGLYPDRNGQTVSNSYDFFRADGTPNFSVVVQVLDRHGRRLRRLAAEHGQRRWTDHARPVAHVHPRGLQRRRRLSREPRAREQQRARVHIAFGCVPGGRDQHQGRRRRQLHPRRADHHRHGCPARDRDDRDRRHTRRDRYRADADSRADERARLGRTRLRDRSCG